MTTSSTSAFVLVSTVDSPTVSCVVNTPVLTSVSTNTYVVPLVSALPPSVTPKTPLSPKPSWSSSAMMLVVAPVVLAVVDVVNVHFSAVVGSMFNPLSVIVTATFSPCVTKFGVEIDVPASSGPYVSTTVSST